MERLQGLLQSPRGGARRSRLRWLGLAAVLSLALVVWEYALNTLMNPEVNWNLTGVAAHMMLDLALVLPLAALALGLGLVLARRFGMELGADWSGLLGVVGVVALTFVVLMLPVTSTRDLAHEWMGNTYGLSLAEVQTTVVRTDLTVQESTQLCSFGSVRNPSLARDGYQNLETTILTRLQAGFGDVLTQMAALLPLLLLGLFGFFRERMPAVSLGPAVAFARWWARPLRLGTVATAAVLLFCYGHGLDRNVAEAQGAVPFNACEDGGPVKEYRVHAIDAEITLNRWGDHFQGYLYVLEDNIPEVRAFESELQQARLEMQAAGSVNAPGVSRVSPGLRKDPIQPLVLRANLGDCVRVHFTNDLQDGEPASMHILGLPHTATNASGAVGDNPVTYANPGQTLTYEIPVPLDATAERAYYFHDHGAGRRRQNLGLFGALVVEPRGATYLDVETGEELDTDTGSNWEAIIIDPNLDGRPDGKSFREFVIFYHEVGDESFTNIIDWQGKLVPLVDDVAGVYRPAARGLNLRSEPFRRRIQFDKLVNQDEIKHGKSLGYSSYPFGDPPTPVPRSYVGEGTKTRLLHGGSEVFHVHHLHGGGDRWRRNPDADPNNDFWKGLTKVPDPNLTSIHLDSQSIGPGTSYNLEHECGAGGCQQGVGDFLFHCHIGHHYISGMWSFWRVFGIVQTAETNMNGFPLFVEPRLFQADNPFTDAEAPSNTPPQPGVSAGDLLGLTVDDNRVIVDDANLTDPNTEIGIREWIRQQLPPPGAPLDKGDATVWDWVFDDSGGTLRVLGEPGDSFPFAGWESPHPGQRPEVLFNAKNGRYTWPLFRPHSAARPPFTARHTGAPWLGEEMKPGRYDGLCAVNGVHPGVDVGPTAVKRFYPVSAITLPIQVTRDRVDPDGQIFVLNEDESDIRNGIKPAEPLAIRSNVGDCVEIIFTNKIPDGPLNKNFSKVNIHSHFVQFDTQASDGVITGMSYEQSVRPIESEGRVLEAVANAGNQQINVTHTDRLRPGVWIGIGLGEGVCGTNAQGQPVRCTEIRQIEAIPSPNVIRLNRPLERRHRRGEAVGVEFVRYHWYSDVDFGTVFYHTHVEFKDWDHGLFGTHIVEPKGSTYHDPVSGGEVRAGTLVDVRVDPAAGGNPVAFGVDGSFREFMLFLHNNSPVEGRFQLGGGTINLRAEPWRLRDGDSTYRFSSVTHGDPHTQEIRAYVGDPVVIRGMGLVERVGGVRFTGHRFHMERYTDQSDLRDTTYIGISERFDVSLEGGAGGPGGHPGDYLYYSTLGRDFESGAWGILRVHDTPQDGLQPLPDQGLPQGGSGFPQLAQTGGAPPSLEDGPGNACPPAAPVREYSLSIDDTRIFYNDLRIPDLDATAYFLDGEESPSTRTPMVVRANAGECLRINLRNLRDSRAGFSVGELLFDPQRSYGSAVGFNHDSTVAPGATRTYEYYADTEIGLTMALNLGDVDSLEDGAWAGVVVEPAGSQWFRPGQNTALPGGGTGLQADIVTPDGVTREFVALFSDQDREIGQNTMPYPKNVVKFNGISYAAEPLSLRGIFNDPADVFRSDRYGDPRHVVTVPSGTPLVYRVGQPWGNQVHVPTLEGHRYPQEPGMPGSEMLYNDVLAPGMTLNFHFAGGAGGGIGATGDYLFLDRRQPFVEHGLWNILRVTDAANGAAFSPDRITVSNVEADGGELRVSGLVSPRAAGDTVQGLAVYDGARSNGACSGRFLGVAEVDRGNGQWQLTTRVADAPSELCIQSPAGGMVSGSADTLVPRRLQRLQLEQ